MYISSTITFSCTHYESSRAKCRSSFTEFEWLKRTQIRLCDQLGKLNEFTNALKSECFLY